MRLLVPFLVVECLAMPAAADRRASGGATAFDACPESDYPCVNAFPPQSPDTNEPFDVPADAAGPAHASVSFDATRTLTASASASTTLMPRPYADAVGQVNDRWMLVSPNLPNGTLIDLTIHIPLSGSLSSAVTAVNPGSNNSASANASLGVTLIFEGPVFGQSGAAQFQYLAASRVGATRLDTPASNAVTFTLVDGAPYLPSPPVTATQFGTLNGTGTDLAAVEVSLQVPIGQRFFVALHLHAHAGANRADATGSGTGASTMVLAPLGFGGLPANVIVQSVEVVEIAGYVFDDSDGNGVRTFLEPAPPDPRTVFLDSNGNNFLDPGEPTTTTATDGSYSFHVLGPEVYNVRAVVPPGWVQTTPNFDVVAGFGTVAGPDIGTFRTTSIGGRVFHDVDGNGVQTGGEGALGGLTVTLDSATIHQTTTTAGDGSYTFTGLGPGTYRVRVVLSPPWVQTTPDPADIPLLSGVPVTGIDFGARQPVILDTTPPDTTILTGPSGTMASRTATFTWTGSDDVTPVGSLEYASRLDPLEFGFLFGFDSATSRTYSLLPDGLYTFYVKARDQAGNVDPTPASRTFRVDGTPPQTTIGGGPSGITNSRTVTFSWSATDNVTPAPSLLYAYRLQPRQPSFLPFGPATSATYSDLPDGTYTFYVKARDEVGNEETPKARTFTIDATPPTTSITSAEVTIGGGASFSWTGSDNLTPAGSLVYASRLSPRDQSFSAFGSDGSRAYPCLPDGTYTFSVKARDQAGNEGTPATRTVVVARTAIVTGAGEGAGAHVRGFTAAGVPTSLSFLVYPVGFVGGVRVAAGDVDGDGCADLVTGAGLGGGPHVRVFSGLDPGAPLLEFFAYDMGYTGGVFVAAGDLDGDGRDEIVTGTGPGGGAHVKAFKGMPDGSLSVLRSFLAYAPSFTGGVSVAACDVDGDGYDDIVTGAGPGGGPHVQVFSGATGAPILSLFAYDPGMTAGLFVACGDVDGDGFPDIVTGVGAGGGPHVKVISGRTGEILASFFAYDPGARVGMRVAVAALDGDGKAEILTAPGRGGGPHVKAFRRNTDGTVSEILSFFAYDPAFLGGVFVTGIPEPR